MIKILLLLIYTFLLVLAGFPGLFPGWAGWLGGALSHHSHLWLINNLAPVKAGFLLCQMIFSFQCYAYACSSAQLDISVPPSLPPNQPAAHLWASPPLHGIPWTRDPLPSDPSPEHGASFPAYPDPGSVPHFHFGYVGCPGCHAPSSIRLAAPPF